MQTGGRALTAALAQELLQAGLYALGVSIDGLAPAHDRLRASPGSHRAALTDVRAGRAVGLPVSSNTPINRLKADQLPQL